jgi:hypothetical protein
VQPAAPNVAGYVVEPHVTFIEPGFYVGVAARSTEVTMTVRIREGGTLLDEVTIGVSVAADLATAAVGTRLRRAAELLGEITGRYLLSRTSPSS